MKYLYFSLVGFSTFVVAVVLASNVYKLDLSVGVCKFIESAVMFGWFFGNWIYMSYCIGEILENGEIDDGEKVEKDENV